MTKVASGRCTSAPGAVAMHERRLTTAPGGHVLTNAGVWTHDGEWIVYDVRSDAAGSLFDGTRIERVEVATGRVEILFESRHGACCGFGFVLVEKQIPPNKTKKTSSRLKSPPQSS